MIEGGHLKHLHRGELEVLGQRQKVILAQASLGVLQGVEVLDEAIACPGARPHELGYAREGRRAGLAALEPAQALGAFPQVLGDTEGLGHD